MFKIVKMFTFRDIYYVTRIVFFSPMFIKKSDLTLTGILTSSGFNFVT